MNKQINMHKEEMGRRRDAERTNNGSGKRLSYTWMLIGRLDGCTPPEITLITSLHEFMCPYNLSINGKQIWLDVCNGGLRETILHELR